MFMLGMNRTSYPRTNVDLETTMISQKIIYIHGVPDLWDSLQEGS